MADNKKYYYLKLKENFFESDEAIILESMPDGYIYSNILLKLYLRSLKNNGLLMFNNLIPYNTQMLATITRHQVGTVEKAIQIFQQLKLIEVLDNGALYMTNIQNFVGKSSSDADRKRANYKKVKQLGQMSEKSPEISPPEIEIEKEIELKKDINIDIKSEVDKKQTAATNISNNIYTDNRPVDFGQFVKAEGLKVNDRHMTRLLEYIGLDGMDMELVKEAVRRTTDGGIDNPNYTFRILDSWKAKGITTVEQADKEKEEFQSHKQRRTYSNQQPAKSNVPDWVEADYKHEASADEQAQLDELKKSLMED